MMRSSLRLAFVSLLAATLASAPLSAQAVGGGDTPSPRAACMLRSLAEEGFRVQPTTDSDSAVTRSRLLTRSLTGLDPRTGMPDPLDSHVQVLDVRVDAGTAGLVLQRAVVMRPGAGEQTSFAAESARLDHDVRARLRDANASCSN